MTEAKLKAEIDYYDVVRQKLAVGPLNYPRHEKIFELLKLFWPEEETIKLLSFFPPVGEKITLAELAEKSGISTSEARKILKKPVKNKTISQIGKEYGLEPLVPGIYEAYFIAKQDNPENLKKVANIYRWLFKNPLDPPMIAKDFELFRPLLPITAKEKLIKIDESLDTDSYVLPYELVEDLINKNEFFAAIPCQCRLVGELSGEPCERAPSEMGCFVTGRGAQAIASFGYGRALSKEQSIQYLKDTEKAGLVHCTSNSIGGEHLMFICNCCPCHCGALKPTKDFKYKTIIRSNFEPIINPELCVECETCLKKCPMDAISHPDKEKMVINSDLCIGCGVCATNCPKNAISLKKVRDIVPPKTKKIGNKMFMQMLGELLA